jgi:cysteinyl-tRNA synthetase
LSNELVSLSNSLGILQDSPQEYFTSGISLSDNEIEGYIQKRKQAREDKDFKLSDKIRDDLLDKGIVLEDSEAGTIWKKL